MDVLDACGWAKTGYRELEVEYQRKMARAGLENDEERVQFCGRAALQAGKRAVQIDKLMRRIIDGQKKLAEVSDAKADE